MAVYEYVARDEAGQIFSSTYEEISSRQELKQELEKMGYILLKARKKKVVSQKSLRVKQADVVAFAYKFAGMCGAGLPIAQTLDTLERQTNSPSLKFIINDVKKSIERGSSLKDAFDKFRNVFSDFFLGMVEAGESSGKLAESLEISAKYLEKRAEITNRLRNAFIYPVVVLIVCAVIITALIIFVVPVFSKIYRQLGVPLPGPTQALVTLSIMVRQWWPVLILCIAGIIFLWDRIKLNKAIKTRWDYLKFAIPVFGRLNRLVAVSHFIRSFAMLIVTGVPILKALQTAGLVANNEKLAQINLDIQKSVQAGNSLAESLAKHNIFPPVIVQLADSGEHAGKLGEMLNKGVEFLDKDIEQLTNSLLVKLEPALTLALGAVIGLILLAVYLPMFDYMAHLK